MIAAQSPPVLPEAPSNSQLLDPASQLKSFFDEVQALSREARAAQARNLAASISLPGGWNVLELLARVGPQTVPQIARSNSTSRQNCQIIVNRLQRERGVEFIPNPLHKRSDLVQLTSRGHALLATSSADERRLWQELGAGLSRNELTAAANVLRQLRQGFRELADEGRTKNGAAEEPNLRLRLRPYRNRVAPRENVPRTPTPADDTEPSAADLPYNLL